MRMRRRTLLKTGETGTKNNAKYLRALVATYCLQAPQPAQPSTFSIAIGVEKDPRFIQLVQGRPYVLEDARVDGKEYFDNTMHDVVIFGWFGDTYYPCSHGFIARWQLGQIQAHIPVMQDGSLNMKGLILDSLTESGLNSWSCPAT